MSLDLVVLCYPDYFNLITRYEGTRLNELITGNAERISVVDGHELLDPETPLCFSIRPTGSGHPIQEAVAELLSGAPDETRCILMPQKDLVDDKKRVLHLSIVLPGELFDHFRSKFEIACSLNQRFTLHCSDLEVGATARLGQTGEKFLAGEPAVGGSFSLLM